MGERETEAAGDAADLAALIKFRRRLALGEEELVPAPVVNRLLKGESPVLVWREYRGLEASAVAGAAGIPLATLLRIEARKEGVPPSAVQGIADALGVTPDEVG